MASSTWQAGPLGSSSSEHPSPCGCIRPPSPSRALAGSSSRGLFLLGGKTLAPCLQVWGCGAPPNSSPSLHLCMLSEARLPIRWPSSHTGTVTATSDHSGGPGLLLSAISSQPGSPPALPESLLVGERGSPGQWVWSLKAHSPLGARGGREQHNRTHVGRALASRLRVSLCTGAHTAVTQAG